MSELVWSAEKLAGKSPVQGHLKALGFFMVVGALLLPDSGREVKTIQDMRGLCSGSMVDVLSCTTGDAPRGSKPTILECPSPHVARDSSIGKAWVREDRVECKKINR